MKKIELTQDWNVIMAKLQEILQYCAENDEMEQYWCITDCIPNAENTVEEINKFIQQNFE
jgi:hypothetical protein